jgi:hypothetical protein
MSSNTPLAGLIIRTAHVRQRGLGYIYAADPKKEQQEIPHAITFRYKDGLFTQGSANFDALSLAVIAKPEVGLVAVSGAGYYSAIMSSGTLTGDIIADASPPPPNPRTGGIRGVTEVGGRAYAAGLRGIAYMFNDDRKWLRIDEGLPDTFNIQAIHGFNEQEVYAVGREGEMWQSDGRSWTRRELPTSVTLTTVRCATNGLVYVAGHGGVLLVGRGDSWLLVDQTATKEIIWDTEWFKDNLYVSTMSNLFRLAGADLESVDFGKDTPKSFYQLSSADGEMWVNGEFDIMSFDGIKWTRIV